MARQHVDVSQIVERRLRPIYDCLDNGNNKKALQEAEKVLRKQKDLQCARVLKALAVLRLGRQEESLAILREVHGEAPVDDATLQAMTICYRELHKIEDIADAYERAIKKEPTNEELLSHLFMAYVRLGDYKKQQQVALSLYKLKPKNPYYFWSVMSIFMQAVSLNEESVARKVTLPLAEKMCQKFMDEGKIEAEAELELYLMILERQEKFEEMLNVIESSIGLKLFANHLDFVNRRKSNLYFLLKKFKDAFEEYKKLIDNNLDQVDYYIELYEISSLLDEEFLNLPENAVVDCEQQHPYLLHLIKFLEKCVEKSQRISTNKNSRHLQRGPFIARILILELLKKRQQIKRDVDHLIKRFKSTEDLLFEYFQNFGCKFACIYDMFYMISKCDVNAKSSEFLILNIKQSLLNIGAHDLDHIQRILSHHYLSHYLGHHDNLSKEERFQLVNELMHYYDEYFEAEKNVEQNQTEPQVVDSFIILIGQLLLGNNFDDENVFQLVVIFEKALIKSPANYYLKLFLMKIYNAIGAVNASQALLETLDIKHIQFDTLGYLMSTPFITSGHFSAASIFLGNSLRFYSANYKDTLDYLISCYKYGSFTKVEEIIKLRERLNNSIQYCSVAVERMILDLILETKNHNATENIINYMEIDPEKDKFIWQNLCDNRDFTILRSNHLKFDKIIEEKKMQTFLDDVLWLKIRNLLIRAIAAAHYTVSESAFDKVDRTNNGTANGTEKKNSLDILSKLIDNFKEYINTVNCSKTNFNNSFVPIQGPPPSRIFVYSQQSHLQIFFALFNFIILLQEKPKETDFTLKPADDFASIVRHLEKLTNEKLTLYQMQLVLEEFVNCIETLSISLILIGTIKTILKQQMTTINKKNKKKKESSVASENVVIELLTKKFSDLVNLFENEAEKLINIIKTLDIKKLFEQSSDTEVNKNSTYLMKDFNESTLLVKQKLEKSYLQSLKELSELLQNKHKYLQSMKF